MVEVKTIACRLLDYGTNYERFETEIFDTQVNALLRDGWEIKHCIATSRLICVVLLRDTQPCIGIGYRDMLQSIQALCEKELSCTTCPLEEFCTANLDPDGPVPSAWIVPN